MTPTLTTPRHTGRKLVGLAAMAGLAAGMFTALPAHAVSELPTHDFRTTRISSEYSRFQFNTLTQAGGRTLKVRDRSATGWVHDPSYDPFWWPLPESGTNPWVSYDNAGVYEGKPVSVKFTFEPADWCVTTALRPEDGNFSIGIIGSPFYAGKPCNKRSVTFSADFFYTDGTPLPDDFKGTTGFGDLDFWDGDPMNQGEGIELLEGFDAAYVRSDARLKRVGNAWNGIGELSPNDDRTGDLAQRHYVGATWKGAHFKARYFVPVGQNMPWETQFSPFNFSYEDPTYPVTFNPNGGTGSVPTITGTVGKAVTIPTSGVSRGGYTFTGWAPCAGGETVGATYVIPDHSTALCAQWKAEAAKITYAPGADDTTGTTPDTVGVTDKAVTLAANGFTRPGYTFTGWTSGARTHQAHDAFTLPAGTTTMTATWTADPASLVYMPGGGTGQMNPTTGVTDETVTLAANGFTRPGYTFTGWATSANIAPTLKEGDAYTLTPGTSGVYATWAPDPTRLTFTPNGGAGEQTPIDARTDETVRLPEGAFTREGYAFAGWATTPTCETVLAAGEEYALTFEAAKMLHACWRPQAASLTYDANGGHGQIPPVVGVTDDEVAADSGEALTRRGYALTGWADRPDAEVSIRAGEEITLMGERTLYAVWEPQAASVEFDANGGSGRMNPILGVTDQTVTIPEGGFTREGHTFTGWATCHAPQESVRPGQEITLPAGGVRLCAQWEELPAATPLPAAAPLPATGASLLPLGVLAIVLTAGGGILLAARTRHQN